MSSSNPKSFYNQADYDSDKTIHKPDEASSSDLTPGLPPPPYSSAAVKQSMDSNGSGYGSVRNSADFSQQDQTGLLGSSFTPRQQNPSFSQPKRYSSCCHRSCCKYFAIACLLLLAIFKWSYWFDTSPSPPFRDVCPSPAQSWQDLPRIIEFIDSVEVVVKGFVSGGHITVIPLQDRHGGQVFSSVLLSPQLQNQATYTIEQVRDDLTRLMIQMPQRQNTDDCVSVELEVRLPYGASLVRLAVNNLDIDIQQPFVKEIQVVDIQTSNADITLNHWSGESLNLKTTNGHIKTLGTLFARDSIYMKNSNGQISLIDNAVAKRTIHVNNVNGDIEAFGLLKADNSVQVENANRLIGLNKIEANSVSIQNANSDIQVNYIMAKFRVVVKTSNAPVSFGVTGVKNNQVNVINSNGPVNLHMPSEFEGHFLLSTTPSTDIIIENEEYIDYEENQSFTKRGTRRGTAKGDLTVQTSHGDVHLAFDI